MNTFKSGLTALAILVAPIGAYALPTPVCVSDNTAPKVVNYSKTNRPAPKKRLFKSKAVDRKIAEVKKMLKNEKLAWMFENCFPNTIDTTVHFRKDKEDGKNDTFVYTGDIHAMWLRDSGAQVWPYIQLANEDPELRAMVEGTIRRQFKLINIDHYANAFNDGPTGGDWQEDLTDMKPELHERKWEIDSLCYPIRLAYEYWKKTGDASIFDETWLEAIGKIYTTFVEQQRKNGDRGPYKFQRSSERSTDSLPIDGWGYPVSGCGLIVSCFRPSDDATVFQYLVPSNFFAVTSLRKAAEILTEVNNKPEMAAKCAALADEVETALKKYATYNHPEYGTIYAFEVDGYGNRNLMDRAKPHRYALSGRCRRERPHLSEHTPLCMERQQPLLLQRLGRRRHRRSAYRLRYGMAYEHHDEGFHFDRRRGNQGVRDYASQHRRKPRFHARILRCEQSRALYPRVVRMAEYSLR